MILENAQTDWLGSRNYFYNTRTGLISDNINDLIDFNHIKFHVEGLYNYLDYGYSVFGQTPIEEIKFLRPNQSAYHEKGKLTIKELSDPMDKILTETTTIEDTFSYLTEIISAFDDNQDGSVIIPTSGGFDSRLLNTLYPSKEKIAAYTYGISKSQKDSFESVYAKKLCDILGIHWERIELGKFWGLINEWFSLYGVSTHAHGMYQMEFYEGIKQKQNEGIVVSGIYGDVWAGSWQFEQIKNSNELKNLAKNYGVRADSEQLKFKVSHDLRESEYKKYKEKLQDDRQRILYAARNKIILISYLLRVPEYYGFKTWSPFLDEKLVGMMLCLPPEERKKRKWQVDYFRKKKLLLGEMNLPCDKTNCLDAMAFEKNPPPKLNIKLLEKIINKEYLEEIDRKVTAGENIEKIKYMGTYSTLYPIQKLLEHLEG